MTAALEALLAEVCGYHTGAGCEHCADAITYRRGKGWTDHEIIADATLFRDDKDTWYELTAKRAGVAP